jgi:PAS domain-containing protein
LPANRADGEFRLTYVNETFCKIADYTEEKLIGGRRA